MQLSGTVIKTSGKTATVYVNKNTECAGCNACGAGKASNFKLRALNTANAQKGDSVVIAAGKDRSLVAAVALYALPLLFAAIGLLIGSLIGGELAMLASFFIMLCLSFAVLSFIDKMLIKKAGYAPEIIKITEKTRT